MMEGSFEGEKNEGATTDWDRGYPVTVILQ